MSITSDKLSLDTEKSLTKKFGFPTVLTLSIRTRSAIEMINTKLKAEDADKLVNALINSGADVTLSNRRSVTPLHLAAQYSDKLQG